MPIIGNIRGPAAVAQQITLHHPAMSASAVATNLGATSFNAVSDPNFRQMVDARNLTTVRLTGRIGGSLVAATKIRVQYHLGGNIAIATGDAGWVTFLDSNGSHTLNTLFSSANVSIPSAARVANLIVRVGLFSGDGAADPTITCAVLSLMPS